jgi:hypothetical protein
MKKSCFIILISTFILFVGNNFLGFAQNKKIYECEQNKVIIYSKDSLQQKKMYQESLLLYLQDTVKNPKILYNIAVDYAKLGIIDSAFYYLNIFCQESEDDRQLIVDKDFDTLKRYKEKWNSIIQRVELEYIKELKLCVDTALALKLFYLGISDQLYRLYFPALHQVDDSVRFSWAANDVKLENELQYIIEKYGFPSISMAGNLGCQNAFYILQHSLKIKNKYYKQAKELYKKNDFNSVHYAMLTDRWLQQRNRKQIYGTQFFYSSIISEKKYNGKTFLWPVKQFSQVNERRKHIGITITVEDVAIKRGYIIPEKYYRKINKSN